jgi:hypothetical protein
MCVCVYLVLGLLELSVHVIAHAAVHISIHALLVVAELAVHVGVLLEVDGALVLVAVVPALAAVTGPFDGVAPVRVCV